MNPIITIGMPVFNDIDFIEKSIESILKQSEQNFQFIISDDGATDGSSEICKKYAEKDSRIKYIRQSENLGISKNMEFLVRQAETKYFMWAADDDLWAADFIHNHIAALEQQPKAIVSFGRYQLINEDDEAFKTINVDYASRFRIIQVFKLIWFEDDGFGYGVFRTDKIKSVRFPIWWWPNRKTPYNNIYPSLCYYLNNGKYLHQDSPLFFKRVKTGKKINHIISGNGKGMNELFSYYLRRLYLIFYSNIQLMKSTTGYNVVFIFPFMFLKWFIFSSIKITFDSLRNKIRQ